MRSNDYAQIIQGHLVAPTQGFLLQFGCPRQVSFSQLLNLELNYERTPQGRADGGRASVLDGTVNANDLRNNKKQLAVTLAKTAVWTLTQRHPLFIVFKYVFTRQSTNPILSLISRMYSFMLIVQFSRRNCRLYEDK
ncbi:hypothetical protein [Rhizobium sp. MHM7A]|uniref:hypothetical protein n=1 Tax=Rhizobium sp. MHM7A TaxID=2583233 RepID=UPI0011060871|nr:hypothetical protein [Rhizobium sp. MHM7A]TLX16565.1 hypothetical protein FFR93_04295 [Rhizobium sp. MHM7A]